MILSRHLLPPFFLQNRSPSLYIRMHSLSFDERAYDLSELVASQRESLLHLLDEIPKTDRIFLLDETLRDPLSLVAGDVFKGADVMLLSSPENIHVKAEANLVFIFDATSILQAISSAKTLLKTQQMAALHFLVTPCCDQYIEQLIFDTGLSDQIHTLEAFPYHSVLLDSDVLTLNLPQGLNHMLYQKSMIAVQRSAKALLQIAEVTGLFKNIHARGPEGIRCLHSFLAELKSNCTKSLTDSSSVQPFAHVFIIDRSIDLLSLTLEPWTYEALLAETFPFRNSSLQTDEHSPPTYLNTLLDMVYKRLKTVHISQFKTKVDKVLEELKEIEKEKEQAIAGRDNLSMQQIRLLREKSAKAEQIEKLMEFHVDLANKILKSMSYEIGQSFVLKRDLFKDCTLSKRLYDYLLGRIFENAPLTEIIQFYLLILIIVQPKAKDLQLIRSNISARYGLSADFLIDTLDRVGWIPPITSKSWFKDIRSLYTLWYSEGEHSGRSHGSSGVVSRDISDVFNSRAPLSVRMVERELKAMLSAGTNEQGNKHTTKTTSLSGDSTTPATTKTSAADIYLSGSRIWGTKKPNESWGGSLGEDVYLRPDLLNEQHGSSVLVLFIGGVTFAELAALSILEEQLVVQYGPRINILTIGTDVASGRDILGSLIEHSGQL